MNPWRWVDPRVRSVRLEGVRRYLLGRGWSERTVGPSIVFTTDASNGEGAPSCVLPASEKAPDFVLSLTYLLTTLSELEDRHPVAILDEVLQNQEAPASVGT
jgi:hypothetical protein